MISQWRTRARLVVKRNDRHSTVNSKPSLRRLITSPKNTWFFLQVPAKPLKQPGRGARALEILALRGSRRRHSR